jgi:hypothetical protein
MRKVVNTEIKETEEELNQIGNLKVKLVTKPDIKFLDNDLTLKELQEALSSCKESSPGPDGIPYIIYKK